MRGYRSTAGERFLLLIDGIVFNHLYFDNTNFIPTIPISNIERIEIVYGPASSIYGVNALMGVVNVITAKERKENGTFVNSNISVGFNNYYAADINLFYKKDDFRFSLTGRMEDFDLYDLVNVNSFEWTKEKYQNDRSLWGDL